MAYVCCGTDNSTSLSDFWKFDGSTWTQLRDIANTNDDEDYDDDYNIVRYSTVSFVIDGYAYIATGYRSGVTADYWKYDPDQDLYTADRCAQQLLGCLFARWGGVFLQRRAGFRPDRSVGRKLFRRCL